MDILALSKIAPSPEKFLSDPPRRPLRWSMPLQPLAEILNPSAVDEIISGALHAGPLGSIRLTKDGERLDYKTQPERDMGKLLDDVDALTISRALESGATLSVNDLGCYWPPVQSFLRRLSYEINLPTSAAAFLTPPGSQGFAKHADEESVFVVQMAGSQERTVEQGGDEPDLHLVMNPGDVLWIPHGHKHSAKSGEDFSLHLSIIVRIITHEWVARLMLDFMRSERRANGAIAEELPWGASRDFGVFRKALFGACEGISNRFSEMDWEGATEHVRRNFYKRFPSPPRAPVVILAERADSSTRVTMNHESVLGIDKLQDGKARLRLPDSTITLGKLSADAVARLWESESTETWSVSQLVPQLSEESADKLVNQLLRAGVVRRL
jgi:lysine-specific demethylase/histidyl-hydroxylase NO66